MPSWSLDYIILVTKIIFFIKCAFRMIEIPSEAMICLDTSSLDSNRLPSWKNGHNLEFLCVAKAPF